MLALPYIELFENVLRPASRLGLSKFAACWTLEPITESFFREHLIQEGHIQDVSRLIKISAAQGLEIPYVG